MSSDNVRRASATGFELLARKYVATLDSPVLRDEPPALLVYWPMAQMNKYQALLYSEAFAHGFAVHGISDLDALTGISWPGKVVFHAHWFAGLIREAASEEAAQQAIDAAFDKIEAFAQRTGARLVWTAHNLFPHDTGRTDVALKLRQRTVERFDAVHLLNEEHRPLLEHAYERPLPATFVAPHMTYDGAYPDWVTREQARETLDVRPAQTVFLFFGSLQRYKGLERLVSGFRRLVNGDDPPDAVLILAGVPSDPDLPPLLRELAGEDDRIRIDARRIRDDEIQTFCRAADVMVLPYSAGLNSGAVMLGLTYGLPVIASDTPGFRGFAKAGVHLLDTSDEGLEAELRRHCAQGPHRRAAPEGPRRLDDLKPRAVSSQFFDGIRYMMAR